MTAPAEAKKQDGEEEEERPKLVILRFAKRLQALKKGQEYYRSDKIAEAVRYYNEYLDAIAKYHGVKEERIRPQLFDPKKDLAEMLLISHAYWDLAKAFDRSPKLAKECERCLRQFTTFTVGFKYQYLNSEIIRKFIVRGLSYNPQLFENAYREIRVQSKACYIATYCYGENNPNLEVLRRFKLKLVKSTMGDCLVSLYYRFSPPLVNAFEQRPWLGKLLTSSIIRPTLNLLSIFLRKLLP